MPPRVVHGPNQAGGLQSFLESMPPITRAFAGAIFACALGHYVGIINPASLALMWPQVYNNYHVRAWGRREEGAAGCAAGTALRCAVHRWRRRAAGTASASCVDC
jgi:hypothetical protein